jgi:2-C-methyl-D-erythritol 4-phosphate cytidylyltransferase
VRGGGASGADVSSAVGAVVVAAGRGERLGESVPKAFVEVAGRTLLARSLDALRAAGVDHLVAVVPAELVGRAAADGVVVVAGGATRQESVAAGLAALAPQVRTVLVHDAARALVPAEVVARVVAALRTGHRAVVPGLPVADTLRDLERGPVDRRGVVAVQTPQGFARDDLERAHAASGGVDATDDAGLVEALGVPVHVVAGHPEAFKVTRPLDLLLAEAVVRSREVPA